jgi:hypothetical protein
MSDIVKAIRFRAARRMMWSGVPVVLMICFNLYYAGTNAPKYGLIMTGLAAACVPFLADLVQLVSGISFHALACKWDHLKDGQRYLFVIMAIVLFILFLVIIVPIIAAFLR